MVEVVATADVLAGAFTGAAQNIIMNMVQALPGLVVGILVFLLGWVISVIVARVVSTALKMINLESYLKDHKLDDALGPVKISNVLTKIARYYVLLIFVQAALSFMYLGQISIFLGSVVLYAPVFVASLLLLLIAVLFGEYVKEVILDLEQKHAIAVFIARAAKAVIIYVGITIALGTMGFDTTLLNNIFITILQALVYGIALAAGIAFGFGGQKDAQDLIGRWRKSLQI